MAGHSIQSWGISTIQWQLSPAQLCKLPVPTDHSIKRWTAVCCCLWHFSESNAIVAKKLSQGSTNGRSKVLIGNAINNIESKLPQTNYSITTTVQYIRYRKVFSESPRNKDFTGSNREKSNDGDEWQWEHHRRRPIRSMTTFSSMAMLKNSCFASIRRSDYESDQLSLVSGSTMWRGVNLKLFVGTSIVRYVGSKVRIKYTVLESECFGLARTQSQRTQWVSEWVESVTLFFELVYWCLDLFCRMILFFVLSTSIRR